MPNTAPEPEIVSVIALVAAFNSSMDILLLKRPDHVHCGGKWSLPGGKVEDGEMPMDTAVRELREETGLPGKNWLYLGETRYQYPDRNLKFLLFLCICPQVTGIRAESEFAWVPLESLRDYPMPEANANMVQKLHLPRVSEYLEEFLAGS